MIATRTVYYLTGQGGELSKGLGEALLARGLNVVGRELHGEFKTIGFANQINAVIDDLTTRSWHDDALVVANSFGAYLFLHAQAAMPPYIGRVLLLSPIVGEFASESLQIGFIPPRSKKLFELAQSRGYSAPMCCEIHVGSEDWQSNPVSVSAFGRLLRIPVHVVPNGGHMLDKGYVSEVLDRWLTVV